MARQRQQNNEIETELVFPIEGLDKRTAFLRQRPGTCVDANNVRPFEPGTDRARGGRRMGLVRYFPGLAVTGTLSGAGFPIQDINLIATTTSPPPTTVTTTGQFTYDLTGTTGFGIALANGDAVTLSPVSPTGTFDNSCWDSSGNVYIVLRDTGSGVVSIVSYTAGGARRWPPQTALPAVSARVSGMTVIGTRLFLVTTHSTSPTCRIYAIDTATGVILTAGNGWHNNAVTNWQIMVPSANAVNCLGSCGTILGMDIYGTSAGTQGFLTFQTTGFATFPATFGTYTYNVYGGTQNASRSKVVSDGTSYFYVIASVATSQVKKLLSGGSNVWSSTAGETGASTPQDLCYDGNNATLVVACNTTPSARRLYLIDVGAIPGGSLQSSADPGAVTSWNAVDTDGSNHFTFWRNSTAANDVAFTTGISAGVLDTVSGGAVDCVHTGASVSRGTFATQVQSSGRSREVRGILVCNGQIKTFDTSGAANTTGGGSGDSSVLSTNAQVFSVQAAQVMLFADGTTYKQLAPPVTSTSTWTVSAWTPTSGSLPLDGQGRPARLIEYWNLRVVLAGLIDDPTAFFMGKRGNHLVWDYAETPQTAISPTFGATKDTINTMVPHRDDMLVFGGDHTITLLRGDLLSGGVLDVVTSQLGMAFGRPWALDPAMQLYFFSTDGAVYKMTPGANPICISQQIKRDFQSVNLSTHRVRMAWDMFSQGLCVWITPNDPNTETINYFFDERTNSWWPDFYGKPSLNPTAVFAYDGDSPDDRKIMLGGRDGRLRIMSADADDDDNTPIRWNVTIGPIKTPSLDDLMFKIAQATLSDDSGDIAYEVFSGDTPEEALAATNTVTGTWVAGRNNVSPINRSAFVHFVDLSGTDKMAIERIAIKYKPLGAGRRIQ